MQPRIPPAPLRELGPLAWVVSRAAGLVTFGDPPRIFTTLGQNRRLFRSWIPFAATMLFRTRLERADVELVVLRTACNCSCSYEWVQHVALATKAGLSPGAIASVSRWSEDGSFTHRQRVLLAATDELHGEKVVKQANWERLTALFDRNELMELCMLVGHYEMLAMTLNSLGVQPEPGILDSLDVGARATAEQLRGALDLAQIGVSGSV